MLLRLYLERRICLVELGNLWRSRRDSLERNYCFHDLIFFASSLWVSVWVLWICPACLVHAAAYGIPVFPAELSPLFILLEPHWMWWSQQWQSCPQGLSASHSTGLSWLSISMRYELPGALPAFPLPHTKIVSGSFGGTYKPTSVFDASANSRWASDSWFFFNILLL